MELIRQKVLESYGVDINEAKTYFSTQNYAFIFPNQPTMIRVSHSEATTRKENLSEAMWLDDLKLFIDTICEPFPSKNNQLVEELEVEGTRYRIMMFRTAKGAVQSMDSITPMYFIAVGNCLGRIHAAGAQATAQGFRYKRKHWKQDQRELIEMARPTFPPALLKRAEELFTKMENLPEDPSCFGIIHGDFHSNNFFVDGNNIWVFDFDSCAYGFFIHDIASAMMSWLMTGYNAHLGKGCRRVMNEDILPYLRIGYELNNKLPEGQWELMDLFLENRLGIAAMMFELITEIGILEDMEAAKQFFLYSFAQPDILAGFDTMMQMAGNFKVGFDTDKA